MDDYLEILNKLRRAKRLRELTNKDIAAKSGHPEWIISKLFRGENVSLYAFLDTCTVMGIEVRII